MAEEKKPAHSKKPGKKKPRKIITTRHDDNTFSHEHVHDGQPHPTFAGTSQNVEDVQQHMADHFGGAGGGEQAAEAEPSPAPAAAAAPPEEA